MSFQERKIIRSPVLVVQCGEAVLILFMQGCESLCDGYRAYKGLATKLSIYINPSFLHHKFWTE